MVINMIGLCGAGKTTIARALSKHYHLPVVTIGEFRAKALKEVEQDGIRESLVAEVFAWLKFNEALIKRNLDGFIICTSGLNHRLEWILKEIRYLSKTISVKLVCGDRVLEKRVAQKKSREPFCSDMDKSEFNKMMRPALKTTPADITIDTGRNSEAETIKKIIRKIGVLKMS